MIKRFLKDESGIETMEYAIIAALVAGVALFVYSSDWGTVLRDRLIAATNVGSE
jgi:Flp pilus assembly pilin Flp